MRICFLHLKGFQYVKFHSLSHYACVYDSILARFVLVVFQSLEDCMWTSGVSVVEGITGSEWSVASITPLWRLLRRGRSDGMQAAIMLR